MPLDLAYMMGVSFMAALAGVVLLTVWVGDKLWKLMNKRPAAIFLAGLTGFVAGSAVCLVFAGFVVTFPA